MCSRLYIVERALPDLQDVPSQVPKLTRAGVVQVGRCTGRTRSTLSSYHYLQGWPLCFELLKLTLSLLYPRGNTTSVEPGIYCFEVLVFEGPDL